MTYQGWEIVINGRPFIVYAVTRRAAARTVSFHYYLLAKGVRGRTY